eukprot:COSAG01_NODE_20029_length_975_cov_1.283105_2_plen_141_part_01
MSQQGAGGAFQQLVLERVLNSTLGITATCAARVGSDVGKQVLLHGPRKSGENLSDRAWVSNSCRTWRSLGAVHRGARRAAWRRPAPPHAGLSASGAVAVVDICRSTLRVSREAGGGNVWSIEIALERGRVGASIIEPLHVG